MPIENDLHSLLKSIELTGSVSSPEGTKIIINGGLQSIIDRSSGRARLRPSVVKEFSLIIGQPVELAAFENFKIRCLICNGVISYPSWYMKKEYMKNTFHYFLCCLGEKVEIKCK